MNHSSLMFVNYFEIIQETVQCKCRELPFYKIRVQVEASSYVGRIALKYDCVKALNVPDCLPDYSAH